MKAKREVRLGLLLVLCIVTVAWMLELLQVAEAAQQSSISGGSVEALSGADTICRLGYSVSDMSTFNTVNQAQLASLRSSWYLNWTTADAPPHPNGMEYSQIVRVHQVKAGPPNVYTTEYALPYTYTVYPSLSVIKQLATGNPRALWQVGNEIDRRDWPCNGYATTTPVCAQDEILPELYADAYHEIYSAIKQADPSAQIAIAGMVEITPMRLDYLDKIWNAYQSKYGVRIPVDVWNYHLYLLPEAFQQGGAETPPGDSRISGTIYTSDQHDNVGFFSAQTLLFRQWLAGKGERNKPLILSEYGILYPEWVSDELGVYYTYTRVNTYMNGTFDYLFTATDPSVGYPLDNNRMVQRWNWVSLDIDPRAINGTLFSTTVGTLSHIGKNWVDYINNPAKQLAPAVNFKALSVSYSLSEGPPSTATVVVKLSNCSFCDWTSPVTIAVKRADGSLIGLGAFTPAPGCGAVSYAMVQAPNLTQTLIGARVEIDPFHQTPDTDFSDNSMSFDLIFLPKHQLLPLIVR